MRGGGCGERLCSYRVGVQFLGRETCWVKYIREVTFGTTWMLWGDVVAGVG